jgi:hypothetical protein
MIVHEKEKAMHTDEKKKYDTRIIEIHFRRGMVLPKDYETYLSKLPDVGNKVYNPEEEDLEEGEGLDSRGDSEEDARRKGMKKRGKG